MLNDNCKGSGQPLTHAPAGDLVTCEHCRRLLKWRRHPRSTTRVLPVHKSRAPWRPARDHNKPLNPKGGQQ